MKIETQNKGMSDCIDLKTKKNPTPQKTLLWENTEKYFNGWWSTILKSFKTLLDKALSNQT